MRGKMRDGAPRRGPDVQKYESADGPYISGLVPLHSQCMARFGKAINYKTDDEGNSS
jgi:hypothetical protein